MPFRVNHVNKRTGVTYVYESVSLWDKELKQSRNKQVCIGRSILPLASLFLPNGWIPSKVRHGIPRLPHLPKLSDPW